MEEKEDVKSVAGILRQKAEDALRCHTIHPGIPLSEIDTLRLINELQVHQIELEMQNEELKLAKEQAELASQRYSELYDFAPLGYFTLSRDGEILELNLNGAQMLRKERLNLINLSFSHFVSPETKPVYHLFLRNIFKNGTKETCEVTLSLNDHSSIYVYLSGICIGNGDQCIVNATDISARKQAEAAFRESEERKHALILDAAMDGYCLLDGQGYFLEVNESYCRMTGYSKQEMLTMRISNLESVESVETIEWHIKKAHLQGELRFETQHQRKDGNVLSVEVSIQFRPVNEGQFVAFIHDITARKQAERALNESTEQFRLLFEKSLDAIFFTNPDGTIYSANPGAEKMLGRRKEEIISLGRDDISNINDPRLIPALEERRKIGSFTGEITYLRKVGTIFPVDITSTIFQDSSGIERSSIIARDITERKQAEVLLAQSEERSRTLFNSMIEGFCIIEMIFDENQKPVDYRILETNVAYEEHTGLSGADGKLMRTLAPEMEQYWFDLYGEIALTGEMMRFEKEAKALNRWLDVCAFRMGGQGSLQVAVCITDISERKHAEAAQLEILELNRLLFENSGDAILLAQSGGSISSANPEACRLFGRSEEEIIKLGIGVLVDINDPILLAAIEERNRTGRFKGEVNFLRNDGTPFPIEISSFLFCDSQGIERTGSFFRDITDRKQAEIALRESEFFFRESQQAGFIGSFKTEFKTGFWESSDVLDQICGIDKSFNRSNKNWLKLVHPGDRLMLYQHIKEEVIKNRIPFNKEFRIIRMGDGEMRWVQGMGKIVYDGINNAASMVGTLQDITRRKVKQEKLHKLNRTLAALSKSSQAMSQAVDEASYLKQVCNIVVEDTDFAMVWIGFAEEDEVKTVRPVASAGFKDDYLQIIQISWDDSALGQGPTGRAIRTGTISMCNNILTDPAFEPWREQALKRGYASSIVLPLKTGSKTFGCISIYSKEVNSFLEDEIKLLSELANDLAHGITTLRLRAAHRSAEEALSQSHRELELLVKERTKELQITNELLKKEIKIGKQQEQSLKIAEEKYRTVADHTHGWEFWLDKDDHFLYCSPSCERITGYKASEFLNNSTLLYDIIHPNDKKKFLKHKKKGDLSQIEENELEYRIVRADGSIRWIGHECQPIADESGNCMGIRGSNKDITKRKEIEQLLKTSSRKYRLLSVNISDGIFICKNGSLEYVNKAMRRIFGYTRYKMEGLMLTQLAMPEYHEELQNILSASSSVNQVQNIEVECLKKDHSTIHVEILLNYVAKEKVIYGVVHDISEKKQIQNNIVKAIILTEEKERAHFSKELHDGLGPLLSTIKLYLQWSQRPKNNKSREEILLLAEGILEEALTTVKEISNKLSPHLLINYGLSSAIQSFVDKLEETAIFKIDFESNVSRRLGNEIEAALYRAVIECINNTIKYAQASNIYIRLHDTDSQLQLEYRDDGIGFDLEKMLSQKKGLGLYNLQNRIETIGGKISMDSIPTKGIHYQIVLNL